MTLFETTAREVSFEQSTVLAPGIAGKAVLVDGVPLNHETFDQPYGTGRLSGLLQLRDQIAPQYQMQLDEIARNLVTMFAESDQTGVGATRRACSAGADRRMFRVQAFRQVLQAPSRCLRFSLHLKAAAHFFCATVGPTGLTTNTILKVGQVSAIACVRSTKHFRSR